MRRSVSNLIERIEQSLPETKVKQSPEHHGWSDGELTSLSSLLHLIAAVLLDQPTLTNLAGTRSTRTALDLNPVDIQWLIEVLFERTRNCAPSELADTLPHPAKLNADIIKEAMELRELDSGLKDLAVGYAYQMFAMPERRQAQDAAQSPNKSLTLRNLVSFTQLYTPSWVVDFLIARSFHRDQRADDFRVIDPACGAGHFLVRAFDKMEAAHTAQGQARRDTARLIAERGIFGVDIDQVAVRISSLSLALKAITLDPSFSSRFVGLAAVCDLNEKGLQLGTLDRSWSDRPGHPLATRYDAVITNPPYLGRKLMSRQLKQALRKDYPDSCQDICTAFIKRSLELLKANGRLALITQSSLLYLPSAEGLRKHILGEHSLIDVVEAGTGVFPLQAGEKVDSVLLVIENGKKTGDARFIDLRQSRDKQSDLGSFLEESKESPQESESAAVYYRSPESFLGNTRSSFNYSCPPSIIRLSQSQEALEAIADVRQGLATSDNERFVRLIWDVDPDTIGSVWHPYAKGAGAERWFSPIVHVVKWGRDGSEIKSAVAEAYPYLNGKTHWVVKNESYYFRKGLTFSFVGGSRLSVRHLPAGCIFDVGASAIFQKNSEPLNFILGYLNSSLLSALANVINPTINFQVGDIRRLPLLMMDGKVKDEIAECASICVELKSEIASWLTAPANGYPLNRHSLSTQPSARKSYSQAESRLCYLSAELSAMEERIDALMLRQLRSALNADAGQMRELNLWLANPSINPAIERTNVLKLEEREFACRFLIQRLDEMSQRQSILLFDLFDPASITGELSLSPDCAEFIERSLGMPIADYLVRKMARDLDRTFRKAPPYLTILIENTFAVIPLTLLRRAQSDSVEKAFRQAPRILQSRKDMLFSIVNQLVNSMSAHKDWSAKTLLESARKERLSSSL